MSFELTEQAKSVFHSNRLRLKLPQPEPVTPGLCHFTREVDGFPSRFHLRVDPDGSGLLVANASAACRLSPSGVFMARSMLDKEEKGWTFTQMAQRFRGVSRQQLEKDYAAVYGFIHALAQPGDNFPITNLDDPWATTGARQLSAPSQADMPVGKGAEDAGIQILHRLWEAGIPQVCFLAPAEPDGQLVHRLVERAEDTGMIAGVRIRGTDLMQPDLLNSLAQAGVDYFVVPFAGVQEIHESLFGAEDYEQSREAFHAIAEAEVCPVAQIPLLKSTAFRLDETVAALAKGNVTNLSFFAVANLPDAAEDAEALKAEALPQVAALVEEASHAANVRFLWEPTVERDSTQTLAEQCIAGPRCAGDVSVRIEPDGSVIPPRGPFRAAGNILHQEWSAIWDDEPFRLYRERVESPTRCSTCPGLALCAADCPKDPRGWATGGLT